MQTKTQLKARLQARFKKVYPKGLRLLAVQLDGFTHSVIFDRGSRQSAVVRDSFSHCMPEGNWSKESKEFFKDIPNYIYQNDAQEYIFILPENR